jgi:hypothetical protein
MLDVTGPFRAHGEITRWHFLGNGETELEYGSDLAPYKDVLKNLLPTGIGLFCTSNRCRTRYLMHKHQPTLVAVVIGTSADHRHFVSAVMLNVPKRQSSKRLAVGQGRDGYWIFGPDWDWDARPAVDIQCPRCHAHGTLAAQRSATMLPSGMGDSPTG